MPSDEDREEFGGMMDLCRIFASESSNVTNPIVFEPMVMSIVLGYQKKLQKLEGKFTDALKKRGIEASFEAEEEGQVGYRGIRLSRINAKFQPAFDLTPFLGKLQQHGIVKIVFEFRLHAQTILGANC